MKRIGALSSLNLPAPRGIEGRDTFCDVLWQVDETVLGPFWRCQERLWRMQDTLVQVG